MIASSPGLTPSPIAVDRRLLVSYDNYPAAQRAVDSLSDAGHPVHNVAIVGSDLRLEETVTGRLTNARAAISGAISGAVFGLVVGLFLGLFTTTTASFFALVVWAVLWGAVMGAAFGFASHAFKGGTRDFTSRSVIVAGRYDVLVPVEGLEAALAVLEGGTRPADTIVVERPPSSGPLHTLPGHPFPATAETAPSPAATETVNPPPRTAEPAGSAPSVTERAHTTSSPADPIGTTAFPAEPIGTTPAAVAGVDTPPEPAAPAKPARARRTTTRSSKAAAATPEPSSAFGPADPAPATGGEDPPRES
ncbi:MAG: hypothetical protein JWQ95_2527 [Sphaerisporangium sp.]|nr:hypothetical protein [Sphaerisporangium sp.]